MDTLKRAFAKFRADDIPNVAAGLTYYAVLSLFPALLAMVALLGVFGEYPRTSDAVLDIVGDLGSPQLVSTLRETIEGVVKNQGGAGALLGVGLLAAIYSASGYVAAFFKAANVIHGVHETRPAKRMYPLRFGLTAVFLGVGVFAALAFVATGSLARSVFDVVGLGNTAVDVWAFAKFPALGLVVIAMIALLYWAAPNVEEPRFRLITVGGATGLAAMVVASVVFSLYVANFGSYNKTYGTLALVPIALTWLWILNIALLFGAEVDAERNRVQDHADGYSLPDERGKGAAVSESEDDEKKQAERDEVDKIMAEVEENPPEKLEDWPDGPAKYRTIGGGDANEDWEDGPTAKLGPADVRYHEDGSVSVAGEKVDNPEDFKGDPIPGGPTDPDASAEEHP